MLGRITLTIGLALLRLDVVAFVPTSNAMSAMRIIRSTRTGSDDVFVAAAPDDDNSTTAEKMMLACYGIVTLLSISSLVFYLRRNKL